MEESLFKAFFMLFLFGTANMVFAFFAGSIFMGIVNLFPFTVGILAHFSEIKHDKKRTKDGQTTNQYIE